MSRSMISIWREANESLRRLKRLNEAPEMSCSVESFNNFVGKEIDAGVSKDQALAIAYSKLKKACGVESDKRMTPKEIVAAGSKGETLAIDPGAKSQFPDLYSKASEAVRVKLPTQKIKPQKKLGFDEQKLISEACKISRKWGDITEDVDGWRYPRAENYAKKLIEAFGDPDETSENAMIWNDIAGFENVMIFDELVGDDSPKPDYEFVYATIKQSIPSELYDDIAEVSGSIIIDGKKNEVTARASLLIKCAVMLGFVQDVVNGLKSTDKTLQEIFDYRMENEIVPDWYDDRLGEKIRK